MPRNRRLRMAPKAPAQLKPPKQPENVQELLGTTSITKQLEIISGLYNTARMPVFTVVLYFDPRPEPVGGFQITNVGPDLPADIVRHMLREGLKQVDIEEKSMSADPVAPTLEPATEEVPTP